MKATAHVLQLLLANGSKNTSEKANNHGKRDKNPTCFSDTTWHPWNFQLVVASTLLPYHIPIYHAQRTSLGLMATVLPSNSPWWKVGTLQTPAPPPSSPIFFGCRDPNPQWYSLKASPVFEPHLLNGVGLACCGLPKRLRLFWRNNPINMYLSVHIIHIMYILYIYITATNKVFKVKELKDIKRQFFVKVWKYAP